jgi:hypothetical protein
MPLNESAKRHLVALAGHAREQLGVAASLARGSVTAGYDSLERFGSWQAHRQTHRDDLLSSYCNEEGGRVRKNPVRGSFVSRRCVNGKVIMSRTWQAIEE